MSGVLSDTCDSEFCKWDPKCSLEVEDLCPYTKDSVTTVIVAADCLNIAAFLEPADGVMWKFVARYKHTIVYKQVTTVNV